MAEHNAAESSKSELCKRRAKKGRRKKTHWIASKSEIVKTHRMVALRAICNQRNDFGLFFSPEWVESACPDPLLKGFLWLLIECFGVARISKTISRFFFNIKRNNNTQLKQRRWKVDGGATRTNEIMPKDMYVIGLISIIAPCTWSLLLCTQTMFVASAEALLVLFHSVITRKYQFHYVSLFREFKPTCRPVSISLLRIIIAPTAILTFSVRSNMPRLLTNIG